MHKNIKHFEITLPIDMIHARFKPSAFLPSISARMPNLESLSIFTDISMKVIEEEACALIRSLPKLKKINTPRFYFTTRVAEELARLSDLGVIEFESPNAYIEDIEIRGPADIRDFAPKLEDGAFPSLYDFSSCLPFTIAADSFENVFPPRNLTALYLDSPDFEESASFARIISVVADNCPLLERLTLNSFVQARESSFEPPPESGPGLDFDALRPILRMPNLTYLELHHHFPFDISVKQMEELASKWPSLETLILNNDPLPHDGTRQPLPLEALMPFARLCPRLKLLGLYLDATVPTLPLALDAVPFKALETLSVGVSPITDSGAVALFLSKLCPLGCELEKGVTWQETEHEGVGEDVACICAAWKKVEELLPLLTKMRMEERERTRQLKAEVEDLRMRTDVLMAKLPPATKDALGCTPF
ncbi:hypothetical protein HGRIS_010942 [Hohenbuehelia grisea]